MKSRGLVTGTAELAIVALSVIVAIGMERLFVDTGFLTDVLVLVVGSHLVSIVCRRSGLGMLATGLVSLVALVLLTTALFYGSTGRAFLPASDTLDAFRTDLSDAWDVYAGQSAPVEVTVGLVAATGILLWSLAFLADWAAFRLRSPFEAVAPATAVFVFTALLGDPRHQVTHGALFAAGVAGVLLTMRAERQAREEVWVASSATQGITTTLRVGAAAGAIAVLAGAVTGPAIPGAGDPALIDVTEIDNGPSTRFVTSPLVEISASLVEQPDVEIFSVSVDREDRDYWRLMALTFFDGERGIWARSSNFDDVRGPVDSDVADAVDRRRVNQVITTKRLGNIYLPAAYEIAEVVDSSGVGLEYETATGALVVRDGDLATAESGFRYEIESAVPDFDPATLPASATDGLPGNFIEEHTQLPDACGDGETSADGCWPAEITATAREITAAGSTDLERARLLQNFFLDPSEFSYDLDVARGHDINSIEDFLFIKRGYCEQFAATFAAMARSIGLPSRVAVGFTWGQWSDAREEYVVRGEHAHAWPEVYFEGAGWIPFDPTPGRNRPHDSDVTGIGAPAQFDEGDEINRLDPGVEPEVPPPTSIPGTSGGPQIDDFFFDDFPDGQADPAATGDEGGGIPTAVMVLAVALLAIAALAAAIPLSRQVIRRRALARVAADPVGRGELAWDDAIDALRLVDLQHRPEETPIEFAARVYSRTGFAVGPVDELARHVTLLRYGNGHDAVQHAISAREASSEIRKVCLALAGRRRVIVDAFDPRTLRPAL